MYRRDAACCCCDGLVEGDSETTYGRPAPRVISTEAQHNCRLINEAASAVSDRAASTVIVIASYMDITRVFSGPGQTSRVGLGRVASADATRPARKFRCATFTRPDQTGQTSKPADLTRPARFENLLTRPDTTRQISKPPDPTRPDLPPPD